ncbi:MAG: urate hydroxylase PuuD, partial [Pelagibacteraceae bacterium]|nr:urate hydroxylase PuuD [Pelagibacteraceae bacterium]
FLFNYLDNKLEKNTTSKEVDAHGILQHSGWYYRVERLHAAPEKLSKNLIIFKWQSYLTFITGILLLIIIYYSNAKILMIDKRVNENITPLMAIGISVISIIGSWLIYDFICKSKLRSNKIIFLIILLIIGAFISFGMTKVFGPKFAFLSVGVILGCIMFFNVFFVIIPNGKNITASALNQKEFDVNLSNLAKARSVDNNIITFLVLFIMLSGHASFIWVSQYNWIILLVLAIVLGSVRHFFNLRAKKN